MYQVAVAYAFITSGEHMAFELVWNALVAARVPFHASKMTVYAIEMAEPPNQAATVLVGKTVVTAVVTTGYKTDEEVCTLFDLS